MIAVRQPAVKRLDTGVVWPDGGTAPPTVGDPFGHRTFSGHSSGVDIHRGVDILDGQAITAVKSPINGYVIRKHYTHFDWENASQIDQLTRVGTAATFLQSGAVMRITGTNAGAAAFPSAITRFDTNTEFHVSASEDWYVDFKFNTLPSALAGEVCFGVYQASTDNYAIMKFDDTSFIAKGKDAGGVFGVDDTTSAHSNRTWNRIKYLAATTSVVFQSSTDGSTWTTIATEASISWSNVNAPFKCFVGFSPAAAGDPDVIDCAIFAWFDAEGIGRFGNWIQIGNSSGKYALFHMSHVAASIGAYVRAGDTVGYTGSTGFDVTSGRILQRHCHIEYAPTNAYIYANNDEVNPMGDSLLPRAGSIAIGVVRTAENDPDGVACHKLAITLTRGSAQRFDVNSFSLTGNTTVRTLNWNTRAGLDPSDHDAVKYDGIYFQPVAFSEASSTYVINLYWSKAVVGATFASAYVKDTAGTTIWSE